MSTNRSTNDLEEWVAKALKARKATISPRVGFEELAAAAGVSRRTAIRHLGSEQRGATAPHIPVGPLYGYAQALRTTVDDVIREAVRLREQDASKESQEREAASHMTQQQHEEVRAARGSAKGRRAKPRKGA